MLLSVLQCQEHTSKCNDNINNDNINNNNNRNDNINDNNNDEKCPMARSSNASPAADGKKTFGEKRDGQRYFYTDLQRLS